MIYKSKSDSTKLHTIQRALAELDHTSAHYKKAMDSLIVLYQKIHATAIIGHRTVYSPAVDHITLDSLQHVSDLWKVTKISIHNYNSPDFPLIILDCKNLESLELINTAIRQLPVDLNRLTKLREVKFYNHPGRRKIKLKKNNHVKELIIKAEHGRSLPRSYRAFTALKNLDLAGNNLKRLPQGARHNKALVELNLQYNKITLRQRIKKHPYLETLELRHNQIKKIPRSIRQFRNLRKLNFNYNQIASVHPAIRKLTRIEHLSFYHNELSSIPSGVYDLTTLREIDLFHNKIEHVDHRISQWKNLRMLYLSHNQILSLPEETGQLSSLEGLYLWDNRITGLPDALGKLHTLKFLWVNNNNLQQLPQSLFHLQQIEELDISHNFMTEIPEAVFDFRNIRILSLVNNPWNEQTRKFIPARTKQLRARNVFVQISD